LVKIGLIRAKRVKVGRIKGFIGEKYGRKSQVEDKERGYSQGCSSSSQ